MQRSLLALNIFGIVMVVVFTILFVSARIDLPTQLSEIVKVLGLGFFFVNFPFFLANLPRLRRFDALLVLSGGFVIELLFFGLFSLSPGSGPILIAVALMVLGGWWAMKSVWEWLRHMTGRQALVSLLMVAVAAWFSISAWNNQMLSPVFWERLVTSNAHPDTLFHMSITNMIANYQQVSTGVDGLSPLRYHVGSHVIYAGMMKFFHLSPITFFNLAAPIINLSSLGLGILLTATYLHEKLFKDSLKIEHEWWPWLLILISQIGVIPHSLINQLGVAPFHLLSESQALASAVLLLLIPIFGESIAYLKRLKGTHGFVVSLVVLAILSVLPLGLGLIKVSHLFIFLLLSWYGWLRFSLFKNIPLTLALLTLSAVAWQLFNMVRLVDHVASFHPGHYLTQVVKYEHRFYWPVIGFIGFWLVLAATFLINHIVNAQQFLKAFKKKQLLLSEVLGVAVIASSVLVLVFNLGPNGNYFIDIHRWLALAFAITLLPKIGESISRLRFQHKTLLIGLVCCLCGLAALRNVKFSAQQYLNGLADTKRNMLTTYGSLDLSFASENKERASMYQYLQVLTNAAETTTALYIPRTSIFWNMPAECVPLSMIPGAVSGLVSLDGLPATWCSYELFAYRTYQKQGPSLERPTDEQLCTYAIEKGFQRVVVLTSQPRQLSCQS